MSKHHERDDNDTLTVSVYKTFYTEESVDAGESDRAEEVYVNETFYFDELVSYIKDKGFYHASESHGSPRWITTDTEIEDYETGESAQLSLHPSQDEQTQSLWEQVLIEADFPLRPLPTHRGMTPS